MANLRKDKSINIAIIAMGGQGGGVLSKWILDMAEAQGFMAQYTSVPGVAQRTGATIYYIELFPKHLTQQSKQKPVLALTPIPGDVDIVIASEMMESGRALMRGFVSSKTTLIASDHRDYAIIEKQIMGDGRRELSGVKTLSEKIAGKYVCFDMEKAARDTNSIISSVLFGALAGSKALPFERVMFEDTIKALGRAVDANMRGFAEGYQQAQSRNNAEPVQSPTPPAFPPSKSIAPLLKRLEADFPAPTHSMIMHGLKKLVDYQDPSYAALYLDRLSTVTSLDSARDSWRLTNDMARYLALAMAYDDTIRVADLKTRRTRFENFRGEVKAADKQIVNVSEYMHPRLEELCDILPSTLGKRLIKSKTLGVFFKKGRRISTTKLRGFTLLYFMGRLKGMRRKSMRFQTETARIETWLAEVRAIAANNYDLACELAGMQRLLKGYSDTYERGQKNTDTIMQAYENFKSRNDAATRLDQLKRAALQDEDGLELTKALAAQ